MTWSSPVGSACDQQKCASLRGSFAAISPQRSTSFSCSEFHWSSSGWTSLSQYHWQIDASSSVVGVSALYSISFAGPEPS